MEVARAVALAKNMDFDEVLSQTCRNTVKFFGLPDAVLSSASQ